MYELLIRVIADGFVIPVVLVGGWALLFLLPKQGKLEAYSRMLMAGLTSYLLAKLVASVYQPDLERPFQELGVQAGALYLNNPGFPSDHVLFCTVITLAVWFETRRKDLTLVLTGFTLLVAIGRVVALVHTPLDVLGGILFGCIGAIWYLQRERISSVPREKRKKRVE